jgi:hypothetical protein
MAASSGCGRSKCGCGVVQRADGYSGNPVQPITFAASAAGSGSDNGTSLPCAIPIVRGTRPFSGT